MFSLIQLNIFIDEDNKSQKSRELILLDSSHEENKEAQTLAPSSDMSGNNPQQSTMWLGTEDGWSVLDNINKNE